MIVQNKRYFEFRLTYRPVSYYLLSTKTLNNKLIYVNNRTLEFEFWWKILVLIHFNILFHVLKYF